MFSRRPGHRFNRGRVAVDRASSTPLTVYGSDLYQWQRGDLGITIGTGVSAWADQSGKANDDLQGTAANQPLYTASDATLNNQPTVTGDGVNDVMTAASLVTDLTTDDFYLCAIVKQNTWTNGDCFFGGAGTNIPRWSQAGATPSIQQFATVGANASSAATLGNWFRAEIFWSATAGTSYVKIGSTLIQSGNPGTGNRTSSTVFGLPAAAFSNIAVAEKFVVKRAAGSGGPTASERALINAYLQARYPAASF
ncbi:MAG TPA: hypothetical protein VFL17_08660 [Anaerolineae bacterium]|nr:hypothetical protein [Anaerolineae bacterium]